MNWHKFKSTLVLLLLFNTTNRMSSDADDTMITRHRVMVMPVIPAVLFTTSSMGV